MNPNHLQFGGRARREETQDGLMKQAASVLKSAPHIVAYPLLNRLFCERLVYLESGRRIYFREIIQNNILPNMR